MCVPNIPVFSSNLNPIVFIELYTTIQIKLNELSRYSSIIDGDIHLFKEKRKGKKILCQCQKLRLHETINANLKVLFKLN